MYAGFSSMVSGNVITKKKKVAVLLSDFVGHTKKCRNKKSQGGSRH